MPVAQSCGITGHIQEIFWLTQRKIMTLVLLKYDQLAISIAIPRLYNWIAG